MPHGFHELYDLLPKLDCGLCDNPSCQTMARKIAVGDADPKECLPLRALSKFKGNLHKVRLLVEEGVDVGARGTVFNEETGVTYIHPCITEAGKVAAEARLPSGLEEAAYLKYGFYDPLQLCKTLNTHELFRNAKCSPNLGIGKVNVDDKTALIYKDGRINIRQARDKEDAINTIRQVSRSLWGAIICTCGNTSVDCASGGCQQCQTQICPVMSGGPPDPAATGWKPKRRTAASIIFERIKTLETRKFFEEGMKQLDEAFNFFEEVSREFLKNRSVDDSTLKLIEERVAQADKLAIRFIVETPHIYDAAVGLILSGVTLDLTRIIDGLKNLAFLKNKSSSSIFTKLHSEATAIATEAYHNFRNTNSKGAGEMAPRYEEFRRQWRRVFRETPHKDLLIAIGKIAVNGYYISRLLAKPLPI
jgi:ArsR family metal-binding transcriptional regulator